MAMTPKSRGRPYGVMLVLALAAAVVGVMAVQKLRERRIFTLLLQDKDRDLVSLHFLYQREKDSCKEMKRKLMDMKGKVIYLKSQKMELNHKLIEIQGIVASLRENQRDLESEVEEKQKQIKTLTESKTDPTQENPQVAALTEILKQKDVRIEEMKRQLENPKLGEISDGELEQLKNSKSGENLRVGGGTGGENVVEDKKLEKTSDGDQKYENYKDGETGDKNEMQGEWEKPENPRDGVSGGENTVVGEKQGGHSEIGELNKVDNTQNGESGGENSGEGKQLREVSEDGQLKKTQSSYRGESLRVDSDGKAEGKEQELSENKQLRKPGEGQTIRGRRGKHTVRSKKHGKLPRDGYLKRHKISQDGENGMEGKEDKEGSEDGSQKESENSQDGEGLRMGGETVGKITEGENQGEVSAEGKMKTTKNSQDDLEGLQLGKAENSREDEGLEKKGDSNGKNIAEDKKQGETSGNSQDDENSQMDDSTKDDERKPDDEVSMAEKSKQPENSQDGERLKTRDEGGSRLAEEEAAHVIKDPNNPTDENTEENGDNGDDIFEEPRTTEGVDNPEDHGGEGMAEY